MLVHRRRRFPNNVITWKALHIYYSVNNVFVKTQWGIKNAHCVREKNIGEFPLKKPCGK